MDDSLTVPADISFEQAIALTQTLLNRMELGDIADPELESVLTTLVNSQNGARGFFVTYLTDERSLVDQPTNAVLLALKQSPNHVSELLVKNLAMSSAMAITHRRNQNEPQAQGSDRVRSRTMNLIKQLELPDIQTKAQQLKTSAETGTGDYATFLDRWGYDDEQRQVIQQSMTQAIATP